MLPLTAGLTTNYDGLSNVAHRSVNQLAQLSKEL